MLGIFQTIYHQGAGKTSLIHMRGVEFTHSNTCCTFDLFLNDSCMYRYLYEHRGGGGGGVNSAEPSQPRKSFLNKITGLLLTTKKRPNG